MSRRLLAVLLLLGLLAALGVGIVLARSGSGSGGFSPWGGVIVVLLFAGASVLTTRSRVGRWLGVIVFLLAAGGGLYLWWLHYAAEQANDRLAVLKDFQVKQDNWKERWRVKYAEYRKCKDAGDKPPAELLTELKLLRLEWTGLAYRYVALTEGPPHSEGDLGKHVPDWKELGREDAFIFVWGVNGAGLTGDDSQALLAWDQTADQTGHRCVLMADGTTKLVDEASFREMPRTKGRM